MFSANLNFQGEKKTAASPASCTRLKTRLKRSAYCFLNDKKTVDENSVEFKDGNKFDAVDTQHATKRSHVKVSLNSFELAMPTLIKEDIRNHVLREQPRPVSK